MAACWASLALMPGPARALLFSEDANPPEVEWPTPAPAPPDLDALVEYSLREARGAVRYAFDPKSVVAVEGTAVRVTLVVISSSGTPNISHEAFRCTTSERKMLATGHRDGQWTPVAQPAWQKLDPRNNAHTWLKPLATALCDGATPVTQTERIRRRLDEQTRLPY